MLLTLWLFAHPAAAQVARTDDAFMPGLAVGAGVVAGALAGGLVGALIYVVTHQ